MKKTAKKVTKKGVKKATKSLTIKFLENRVKQAEGNGNIKINIRHPGEGGGTESVWVRPATKKDVRVGGRS